MLATMRPKVLIVEDDSGVAYLQQRALERAGHDVLVASTAPLALSLIELGGIDLIVLDYRLDEGRTGLDFYRELKLAGYELPVIMVTGFSQESTVIQALREGVRDFVTKSPEYLDYLSEAVHRVLKQVEIENSLTESEARFQSFMDNSPAVAFIKDEEGRYVYANQLFERLFARVDWRGKNDFDFWPKEIAETLRKNDVEVLTKGQSTEFIEDAPLPGGELRHWLCYKFPIQDVQGRRSLGGMAVDITDRKTAEETLRQRDEQLRHSQKMEALGTLAGGVAHEFNNLLQAILGYSRFAMEGLEETDQRRADLSQVVVAADRAAALTRQLLEFGRRKTLERAPLDPNQVVRDLAKMLKPLIGANIELVVETTKDIGLVAADAGQLQQVLLNLCLNARDAMPLGGRLTIKTATVTIRHGDRPHSADEDLVAIRVSDTGCGMSAEVRQRIFEPFFTTKEIGKGTGLGLAVAYSLVQQQGGELQVDSQPGQGSTFTVLLPITQDEVENRSKRPAPATKGGTELILFADDEPLLNRLIAKQLEKAGYRTLSAANGDEAIRLFKDHADEVALVLADVMMPGVGGYEVCAAVQALRPGTPVFLCSGRFPEKGRPDSGDGEIEFIQKPFEPAALLAKIRSALDKRATVERDTSTTRHYFVPTLVDPQFGSATQQAIGTS